MKVFITALRRSVPYLLLAALVFACFACPSAPDKTDDPGDGIVAPEPPQPEPDQKPATDPVKPADKPPDKPADKAPPAFDASKIPEEVKRTTFIDISAFIDDLNGIIRAKDFDAWYAYLADDYRRKFSAEATLLEISEWGVLKRQGVVLRSLRDYFTYVVYPSRQNDRVDDIEFLGERTVKAWTVNSKGERLVLYNLEKIGDTWMIAVGR